MPPRWTERRFTFDLPLPHAVLVLERVRGTPARVEEKVRALTPEVLRRKPGASWSIQEHLGHLIDLDVLHAGRLDDFLAGVAALRAADMTNRRTEEARHNERPLPELLAEFRRERAAFVARLEAWAPEAWGRTALHPRLQTPMRVIDMVQFVAEHDDHHLAWMTELTAAARAASAR